MTNRALLIIFLVALVFWPTSAIFSWWMDIPPVGFEKYGSLDLPTHLVLGALSAKTWLFGILIGVAAAR